MPRPEVDAVLRLSLSCCGRGPGCAEVSEPGEGRHQLGIAGLRSLLEIRGLQALLGRGSLGGVVPAQVRGGMTRALSVAIIFSHQEEVEQSEAGSREPGELVLQIVVRLLLQTELLQGRQ